MASALALTLLVLGIVVGGCGGGSGTQATATVSSQFKARASGLCRTARREIAQAVHTYTRRYRLGEHVPLANALLLAVGHVHVGLGQLQVPHADIRQLVEFEQVEFELEPPMISLIHVSDKPRIRADLRELAAVRARFDALATKLGIDECVHLPLVSSYPA